MSVLRGRALRVVLLGIVIVGICLLALPGDNPMLMQQRSADFFGRVIEGVANPPPPDRSTMRLQDEDALIPVHLPETTPASTPKERSTVPPPSPATLEDPIHIALTVCETRGAEALNLIKSVLATSARSNLHFHIFHADGNGELIASTISHWPAFALAPARADYRFYNISLNNEWRKMFKPCATQRLFFPDIIPPEIPRVLYFDTDTLLLDDVANLWSLFSIFNSTTLAAVAPEHETKNGWYDRFARHPYYGPLGINSGVMLMDLERMRQAKWVDLMRKYKIEWGSKLVWGDQDLINTLFGLHPEYCKTFPCHWNFRTDHCRYVVNCLSQATEGVRVLHGCRSSFHVNSGDRNYQSTFREVYHAFDNYQWSSSVRDGIVVPLEQKFSASRDNSGCGNVRPAILASLKRTVEAIDGLVAISA